MILPYSTKISGAVKSRDLHGFQVSSLKHQICLHSWTEKLTRDKEHPVFWKNILYSGIWKIQKRVDQKSPLQWQRVLYLYMLTRVHYNWIRNSITYVNWLADLVTDCCAQVLSQQYFKTVDILKGGQSRATRIMTTLEILLNKGLLNSTYFHLFMPGSSLLTSHYYWEKLEIFNNKTFMTRLSGWVLTEFRHKVLILPLTFIFCFL